MEVFLFVSQDILGVVMRILVCCFVLMLSILSPLEGMAGIRHTLKKDAPAVSPEQTESPDVQALKAYNEGVRLFFASQSTVTQTVAGVYRLQQDAKKQFKTALRLNPSLVEAESNLGYVELAQKNPQKALNHFEQALKLNATHEASLAGLGIVLDQTNRSNEAIERLKQLTQLYPEKEQHWFNLGTIYQAQQAHENAINAYQQSLLRNPKHLPSLFNLATIYHDLKQPKNAWTFYQRCIQSDPGTPLALQAQHRILSLQKQFPDILTPLMKDS